MSKGSIESALSEPTTSQNNPDRFLRNANYGHSQYSSPIDEERTPQTYSQRTEKFMPVFFPKIAEWLKGYATNRYAARNGLFEESYHQKKLAELLKK